MLYRASFDISSRTAYAIASSGSAVDLVNDKEHRLLATDGCSSLEGRFYTIIYNLARTSVADKSVSQLPEGIRSCYKPGIYLHNLIASLASNDMSQCGLA